MGLSRTAAEFGASASRIRYLPTSVSNSRCRDTATLVRGTDATRPFPARTVARRHPTTRARFHADILRCGTIKFSIVARQPKWARQCVSKKRAGDFRITMQLTGFFPGLPCCRHDRGAHYGSKPLRGIFPITQTFHEHAVDTPQVLSLSFRSSSLFDIVRTQLGAITG